MHRDTDSHRDLATAGSGGTVGEPRSFLCRTADVDESREVCSRLFFPVTIDLPGPGDGYGLDLDVIKLGPLTAGYASFGTPVTVGAEDPGAYHVNVPVAGRMVSRHSATVVEATPTRAAVYRPVGPARTLWSADCRQLCVTLDRQAVEEELQTLLGRPARGPVDLAPELDLTAGAGRSWVTLVRLLRDEVDQRDGLIYQSLIAERLWRGVLVGLLVAVGHRYREELASPVVPSRPRPVRRAIDAMEGEPHRPYTTAELARVAQVSVRSLQEGFRRHVGVAPMTYLQQVRLERVHEALRDADPAQTTVAAVAHRWGFLHLGRFAGTYRRRYGIPPSATLRREP